MQSKSTRPLVGAAALVALLVAGILALLLSRAGSHAPAERGDANLRRSTYETQTIDYNGATYARRRNITTLLLMGIDRPATPQADTTTTPLRNGGQADFLRVLVFDHGNKVVRQLAIDRDTLTPITVLGVLGNRAGSRTERISLSHGFGDGGKQSCELTADAVANLLYGTSIDYYLAMNMDGIASLNDWLGGITVTLEDDFSSLDPTMQEGATIRLVGDQAEIYLRERRSAGIGTNEGRMARQQQYLDEAGRTLKQRLQTEGSAAESLFDTLSEYFTTNMPRGTLINEVSGAKDYQIEDTITPAGEHSIDAKGFMQFQVDESSLLDAIVQVFYEPV